MDELVTIIEADLADAEHQRATVELLNAYAMDPMGDGRALSDEVRQELIAGLRRHPMTMVFWLTGAKAPPSGVGHALR